MGNVRKVQRINLCDQLILAIIEQIQKGNWAQGSKLPGEIELANSFSVSRNIMREALKILENFGVLDARNGIGTFVSEQAIENIENMQFFNMLKENHSVEAILEFRLMVEPSGAYYAAIRITEEGIAHLRQLTNKMIQKYEENPNYQDDFELHLAIAHYSANPLWESLCQSLLAQLKNSLYAEFNQHASEKTKQDNRASHMAIVDAIANHDAELASHLMRKHLSFRIKLINPDFEMNPVYANRPVEF